MDKEKYIKIVVKVINARRNKICWEHLCYVDRNLYNQYLTENNIISNDLNETLARWCKEDFGVDLSMSTKADLQLLKEAVKDFYKRSHPDIYMQSQSDRQGWMRVWVTRKMKEDLKLYGK